MNSYKDGDVFNPERFLMEDAVTLNKEAMDRNIVFSYGKRICAGEGLARVELFIGLVSILQNFKVSFVLTVQNRNLDSPNAWKTSQPEPYCQLRTSATGSKNATHSFGKQLRIKIYIIDVDRVIVTRTDSSRVHPFSISSFSLRLIARVVCVYLD